MIQCIIVRGPLGVGKTTIGRALAARLQGEYISIDDILARNGLDQTDEECVPLENFLKGNELALLQVKDALNAGTAVVFDGNFYHRRQLEHLIQHLPAPPCVFTLKASLDTCIARDRDRELTYGAGAAAAVHYLVSRFDYGVCIDTDGRTPRDVLAEMGMILEKVDCSTEDEQNQAG